MPTPLGGLALPSPVVALQRVDGYAVFRHKQDLNEARSRATQVVFLGDSITDYWGDQGRSSTGSVVWDTRIAPLGAANFGLVSDTTQSLLWRVTHGELAGRPQVIVLQIGTNNVGMGYAPEQTAAGIAAVISAIRAKSPQSQILLMGLFPRGQGNSDPLTQKIRAVNSLIAHFDDGVHVHYLDLGASFLNPDGTLNRALLPDTLHPSVLGYQVWANAVLGPIDVMLGHPDRASADVLAQALGPQPGMASIASPAPTPHRMNIALSNVDFLQPLILIIPPPSADPAAGGNGLILLGHPSHKNRSSGALIDPSVVK